MSRPTTEVDRFFSKVMEEDRGFETPCMIWTGYIDDWGYGVFHTQRPNQKHVKAHRYSYALTHGPEFLHSVVAGRTSELDHLCLQADCVRVSHLELVTPKVNSQRMHDVHRTDTCKPGNHLRAEFERIDSLGRPFCIGCAREADARRRARKKEV